MKFEPDHCYFDGSELPRGDPSLARWVWGEQNAAGHPIVDVWAPDDVVEAIDVRHESIPTDRGVRVGDTYAKMRAFYPDVELSEAGSLSSTWVLREGDRVMIFEVTNEDYNLAGPDEDNRVISVLAAVDPHFSYFSPRANSDYIIGGCI